MEIDAIREFITVATLGSFAKSAELMHISKPTMSRHIRLLENELKIKLLDRNPHTVSLTPQGRKFYHSCKPIMKQMDQLLLRMGSEPSTGLSIGIHYADTFEMLPECIKLFKEFHTEAEINLRMLPDHNFADLLLGESLDVALELYSDANVHNEISSIELQDCSFLLACPVSRDLSKHPVTAASLAAETVYVPKYEEHPGVPGLLDEIEKNFGIRLYNIIQTACIEDMYASISLGRGLGLIPEQFEKSLGNDIRAVKIEDFPSRKLSVLWRTENTNPNIPIFITLLKESCSDISKQTAMWIS